MLICHTELSVLVSNVVSVVRNSTGAVSLVTFSPFVIDYGLTLWTALSLVQAFPLIFGPSSAITSSPSRHTSKLHLPVIFQTATVSKSESKQLIVLKWRMVSGCSCSHWSPFIMTAWHPSSWFMEAVNHVIDLLFDGYILTPISSAWTMPIVTPPNKDGRTPRIRGDYRITVIKFFKQTSCSVPEPEDVLHHSVSTGGAKTPP